MTNFVFALFFFHAVNFTYLYLIIAWGTEHWVVTYEGKLRYSKSVRSGLAPWTNNVAKHCKWWYVAVIVIGNPGKPIKCYRIGSLINFKIRVSKYSCLNSVGTGSSKLNCCFLKDI